MVSPPLATRRRCFEAHFASREQCEAPASKKSTVAAALRLSKGLLATGGWLRGGVCFRTCFFFERED